MIYECGTAIAVISAYLSFCHIVISPEAPHQVADKRLIKQTVVFTISTLALVRRRTCPANPKEPQMKHQQSGFTLVEIAIVLVIVGLLLGGVLKGQELIAGARVKSLISDFNNISVMVYTYQDKYRGFPGNQTDTQLESNFGTGKAKKGSGTLGNGRLAGDWNTFSATPDSQTEVFWQHVRLANLASGATSISDPNYYPRTSDGGRIGIESGLDPTTGASTPFIAGMSGAFYVCADGIQGRYAKQMDVTTDDGNAETGSVRIAPSANTRGGTPIKTSDIVDGTQYIVCRSY
jgi:prepilin-type N-terminal cleavage/methylation domain-containing protein